MNRDRFWLTDAQFARIERHLPTDTRGKPRVDDRRVISDPDSLATLRLTHPGDDRNDFAALSPWVPPRSEDPTRPR